MEHLKTISLKFGPTGKAVDEGTPYTQTLSDNGLTDWQAENEIIFSFSFCLQSPGLLAKFSPFNTKSSLPDILSPRLLTKSSLSDILSLRLLTKLSLPDILSLGLLTKSSLHDILSF